MENNSLLNIMLEVKLLQKLLIHYSLINIYDKITKFESIKESVDKNILINLYDFMSQVLVEQYNYLVESKLIFEETFELRLKNFKEIMNKDEYLICLFNEYPTLEKILKIVLEDHLHSLSEIVENYYNEQKEIENFFGIKFGSIVQVDIGLGDKHNGKSVVKIDFEHGTLMYKPSNLLSDQLYNEVLHLYEENGITDFKYVKTYSLEDHSWQEVILQQQNLSFEEANRYYFRSGVILSLIHALRGSDIHHENIIVSGEYPIVIDTETLASPTHTAITNYSKRRIDKSVLSSAMLPFVDDIYDIPLSGLFCKIDKSETIYYHVLIENETKDFIYEKRQATSEIGSNAVIVDGNLVEVSSVSDSLIEGFETGLRFIMTHKNSLLKIIHKEKYKDINIRCILRGTQIYSTFIRESKNIEAMKNLDVYNEIFDILLNSFAPSQFGYLRVEEEIYSLKNLDVPLFYSKFDDTNLYSNNKIICQNYFKLSPLTNIIQTLDFLDQEMIDYQKHLIELSLFSFNCQESDINEYSPSLKNNKISYRLENIMKDYIYRLKKYELFFEDDVASSLYFANVNNSKIQISLLDAGLYMGGGIIHLIYTYAEKFNDSNIKLFAKRLIKCLYMQYTKSKEKELKLSYNVYDGYGGLIYLAYNYSVIFDDLELYNIHEEILYDMLNYFEVNSFDLNSDVDYINSIGTTVTLLGRLYFNENMKPILKNKIENFLNNYYEFIKIHCHDIIGFAHGNSGIATALSFVFKVVENNDILNSIFSLITHEDLKIQEEIKNDNISYTWCRGLSGVLYSRYMIKENIKIIGENNFLCDHLIKTINDYNTTQHLEKMISINSISMCHGVAGNIDVLAAVKKLTNDKNISELLNNKNFREEELTSYHWFVNSDYQFESFMLGKSGLIYSLFHLMNINDVPCVNGLELSK